MKVYVVTSGEYSDYGIDAIFSTIEGAEEYKEMAIKFKWGNSYYNQFNIEEWELDEKSKPNYIIGMYLVDDGKVKFLEDDEPNKEYPEVNAYYRLFRVRFSENIEVMKKSVYDQNALYLAKLEDV